MWNWLVSGLASDATIVLYDGSPIEPDASTLIRLADELAINVFGTSASYLAAIEKRGVRAGFKYNLDPLRTILSTGSPLTKESFQYVYREIKSDVCLSSISGGTDIVSCFTLGNPNLPVRSGELQCCGLGMAVDIFDDQGESLRGEKGSSFAPVHSRQCHWNFGRIKRAFDTITLILIAFKISGAMVTLRNAHQRVE